VFVELAEEPLASRREILRTLRLGVPTTEAPFHRLQQQRRASPGWALPLLDEQGRRGVKVYLYSALNIDAARATRRQKHDVAMHLAARAEELEQSAQGGVVRDAVIKASERLVSFLGGSAEDDAWSDRLRRYLDLRRGVGWEGVDREALAREWLVHSEAWLHLESDADDHLIAAVRKLAMDAQVARDEAFADDGVEVIAFAGVVRHLDPEVAEIVSGAGETWRVPRRELDREGLARLGEAVSVIREELPDGGEAWLYAPAALLASATEGVESGFAPFDRTSEWIMETSEGRWLSQALRHEPTIAIGTSLLGDHES
jgi:hypothetical protein